MQPPNRLPADDPAVRISRLPPVLPPLSTPGPFILFDRHGSSGRSQDIDVPNLSTIVLEVFQDGAGGTCDVQVLDAGPFGVPSACSDPAGAITGITGYRKAVVRNMLQRTAVELTVHSGSWSVWVTCIPYGSSTP